MVVPLLLPNGSPIIDQKGNMFMVGYPTEMKQRIVNVFNTQYGTETFIPNYGFDMMAVPYIPSSEKERLFKILVYDAMNVELISNLYGIRSLEVSFTGAKAEVNMVLEDIEGRVYGEQIGITGIR
jgi:hypothetical protein